MIMQNWMLIFIFLVFPKVQAETFLEKITPDFLKDYNKKAPHDLIRDFEGKQIDNPDDPQLNYNLGVALYKEGNFEQAKANFKRVLDVSKDSVYLRQRTYFNLGNSSFRNANQELGQDWENREIDEKTLNNAIIEVKSAIENYKNVLVFDKGHERAKKNLKIAEDFLKKLEEKLQKQQKEKQDKEQKKDQENKDSKDQKENQKQQEEEKKDSSGDKKQGESGQKNKDSKDQKENQKQQEEEKKDSSGDKKQGESGQKNKDSKDQKENQKQQEEEKKDSSGDKKQEKFDQENKNSKGQKQQEEEKQRDQEKGFFQEADEKDEIEKRGLRSLLKELDEEGVDTQKNIMYRGSRGAASHAGQRPW
jgi:Ca-activated chloride channel homolog